MLKERIDALIDKSPVARSEHLGRYEFAASGSGQKVLDVGCGFGYGSHLLYRAGKNVTSIDRSAEAISYAKDHYPGPKYLVGNAVPLEFSNDSFDSVVSFEVMEHLAEPERLIAEAYRVLKPNGTLFVSTPNPRHLLTCLRHYLLFQPWPEKLEKHNVYHLKEYYYEEFLAVLSAQGFKIERVFGQTLLWSKILFGLARLILPRWSGKLIVDSGYCLPKYAATVVLQARK